MRSANRLAAAVFFISIVALSSPAAQPAPKPHIFQRPALSQDLVAFAYAGDLWTVPRAGGRATRLTIGVGIETAPVFSPDGKTIAFTGEYDGNTDVFTIPAAGGVPTAHHLPSRAGLRCRLEPGRQADSLSLQSRVIHPKVHAALHHPG